MFNLSAGIWSALVIPFVFGPLSPANQIGGRTPERLQSSRIWHATSTSEVDGRAFVGGNLCGGNYQIHTVPTIPGLNALTAGGNLSGSVNVNGPGVAIGGNLETSNYNRNGRGNAYIGGSWTGQGTCTWAVPKPAPATSMV
jgi:hypothetical protein